MVARASLLALILWVLAACAAYKKDWPQLTDAPPGPEGRERVLDRSAPVRYEPSTAIDLVSYADAERSLSSVAADIDTDKQAYMDALNRFQTGAADAASADLWFGLQIVLTRLSHTTSRLDPIITASAQQWPDRDLLQDSRSLKDTTEAFIINERQRLIRIEPKN